MPDAADTPPARTPWNRAEAWKWARRGMVVLFVGGGLLYWRGVEPLEVALAFDVDPVFAADTSGSIRREELRRLHGRVIDSDGAEIAKLSIDFPTGLDGPVTPTVVLRLARGRYIADLRLAAEGPREASRAVALTVEEAGFRRIDLGR
jgi:hypothetical protein